MVNITFNSLDYHKRYEPVEHFFLEIDYHGTPIRIDIGRSPTSERPDCIHIISTTTMKVDHHSVNAADITPQPSSARREG